jgi:hypothetical protein
MATRDKPQDYKPQEEVDYSPRILDYSVKTCHEIFEEDGKLVSKSYLSVQPKRTDKHHE